MKEASNSGDGQRGTATSVAVTPAAAGALVEAESHRQLFEWLAALRRSTPDRAAVARFVVSPTSYLLLGAVLVTLAAKLYAAFQLKLPFALLIGLWSVLPDALLYFGFATVFASLEGRRRSLLILTLPLAVVLFLLAGANAAFLAIAGEQGNWDALVDLWERRRETRLILDEDLANGASSRILALAVLSLIVPPLAVRFAAKHSLARLAGELAARGRARVGAWLALPAGALSAIVPPPAHIDAFQLGESAIVSLVSGAAEPLSPGSFRGFTRPTSVSDAQIRELAARSNPDVLLIVLESARFDHTSLAGREAKATTPNLAALAARGFSATETRAVLPHTTKSLFTLLCGRIPVMQRGLIELDARLRVQCLPRVLDAAGYRTAFFQSATGTFEQRPRLVDRLGFGSFRAAEDLGGKRLGYVASEDASVIGPVLEFFEAPSGPKFVTVLTSAAHHPYRLPKQVTQRAKKRRLPYTEPADAYARLIEEADRVVGELVEGLEKRGRLQSTLIVVVGDHGEGFGQHGVRQHDNNFYEEGLRVPFVIAGPGVASKLRFEGNASLLDVAPTLFGLLGVAFEREALDGFDLLRNPPGPKQARPFGCFRPMRCRGVVVGDHKLIFEPKSGRSFLFDLAKDPAEELPRVVPSALEAELEAVNALIDAQRIDTWTYEYAAMTRLPPWQCPEGRGVCLHPRATRARYRLVSD